jgi:hypothetical protein
MNNTSAIKTTKLIQEFFLASLLVRIPGKRGRHAWRRKLLRASSPRCLLRMIDGRAHSAYVSNGIEVIRIELIDVGSTIFAPIADGARAEPLHALIDRINARPNSVMR